VYHRVRTTCTQLFALAVIACWASSVLAQQLNQQQRVEVLNQALRAFDRGAQIRRVNRDQALAAFKLYYNLANAYLESGQLSKAILNYRRAEKLIPRDPQLDANLGYARSLCRSQIPASTKRAFLKTLFFWHYNTPLRSRYLAGLAVFILFWLLMIARIYATRFRWRYILIPCLLIWLALGVSVITEVSIQSRQVHGVIVAADVIVRKGNAEGFDPQFKQKLHEGVEFIVVEKRSGWLHIELPDGKTGWIRIGQAELI